MAIQQYPVTPRPYVIFRHGQGHPADTLFNAGTTVVYVATEPQVNDTDGYALNPNAMFPVTENTYLSVATPTTGTVQLLNISGLNYWDPMQLATAINLIGVPSIDQPISVDGVMDNVTGYASGVLDMTPYQSLTVSGMCANPTDRYLIEVRWFYTVPTAQPIFETMVVRTDMPAPASPEGASWMRMPCRARYALITAFPVGGPAFDGFIKYTRSYRPCDQVSGYNGVTSDPPTQGAFTWDEGRKTSQWLGTMPALTSANCWSPCGVGLAHATFHVPSSTARNWSFYVRDYHTAVMAGGGILAGFANQSHADYVETFPFIMGRGPLNLYARNFAATAGDFQINISWL